ncbi:MAG: archaemetzincin-like protein [Promethearchaeota archaeon CR_4]|nr:MAG: archaemetzincin-like protein [Candidatus Lokiarchaeota archaeon CR_4]
MWQVKTKLEFQLNRVYIYLYRKTTTLQKKVHTFASNLQRVSGSVKKGLTSRKRQPLAPLIFPKHLGILCYNSLPPGFSKTITEEIARNIHSFFYSMRDLEVWDLPPHFFEKDVRQRKRASKDYLLHSTKKFFSLSHKIGQLSRTNIIIAFTDWPIYSSHHKNAEFLFGEANRELGVSIVSLAPLREDFYGRESDDQLFLERVLKVTMHELGHQILRNFNHCCDPTCVLSFAKDIEAVDCRRMSFCVTCQDKIEKLRVAFNL